MSQLTQLNTRIIYVLTEKKVDRNKTCIGQTPINTLLNLNLRPNCQTLKFLTKQHLEDKEKMLTIEHCELTLSIQENGLVNITTSDIENILEASGITQAESTIKGMGKWYCSDSKTMLNAIRAAQEGRHKLNEKEITYSQISSSSNNIPGDNTSDIKSKKGKTIVHHKAADALDWNEAIQLMQQLYEDAQYRNSMLIAAGCFSGLRISDLLKLKWGDVNDSDTNQVTITEQKTGKNRTIRLNSFFLKHAAKCRRALENPPKDTYIFRNNNSEENTHISRTQAYRIMQKIKEDYKVKSATVFSPHSLRKAMGRRIWLQECAKGRGEQALILLQDVFKHSSVQITRRYLGIREDEILSVYDNLN